ncbi:TetR/AcrR family transcriptional regulator [Pontibaca methylaminivorans]|uniref:Transcriptional regulator, TetR family n=1 Tax=Pontibaca methylaminivorans TaxID=515897 RepID=A0A1R3WDI0_9RHOB|nr:TetR/AcrR family transcriptional regulator [Pontibaca methylaminivorans]SIT75896.1 transcriptional regulator, TetR family [Pontibaca methylaminivorans]
MTHASTIRKRGYHHGSLREALVQVTLELIQTEGPEGFTLSKAARKAGVTPAAVYRHFSGRDNLLTECAREGYASFAECLADAYGDGQPCPRAAFAAMGEAYLSFMFNNPGYYVAMYESGIPQDRTPELAEAAGAAHAVLERAAADLSRRLPPEKRQPIKLVSAHIRALSHGVAQLFVRGDLKDHPSLTPEEVLKSGVGTYLRGLGVIPQD